MAASSLCNFALAMAFSAHLAVLLAGQGFVRLIGGCRAKKL